jgi:LysM repeat protein
VDTILALNNWQVDWPLQIGQRLLIYPGKITPSPTPRPLTAIEKLTPDSDGNYYHTVASGEYLAWIAELYEVSLADLMAWNGLTEISIIRPGQQLLLRVTPPASETPTPLPYSATPSVTATPRAPAATKTMAATFPSITPTTVTQEQDNPSGWVLPVVIVLAVAGLLILGLTRQRL